MGATPYTNWRSVPKDVIPDRLSSRRAMALDLVRGLAIVAMVVFHFARDLEMFGALPAGTTLAGGWAVAARLIAGTFLFLVGVSLVLAHEHGIRWAAFRRRALIVGAAALAVSLATYAVMPERMVYFGILHAILVASLLGLPLVRLPSWAALVAAGSLLLLWVQVGRSLPIDPWFGWTGLAVMPRPALDLIPVVPWLAVVFFGIAFAKQVDVRRFAVPSNPVGNVLARMGRHSLAIYLLHQPLLIGATWLLTRI